MNEPDLLKIQRRTVRLLRSATADLSRLRAEIQEKSRKEEERARSDSSRLEVRINTQLQEAHTAFDQARDALKRRNLLHLVQMVPAKTVTPSPGRTGSGGGLLKDHVAAILRALHSVESGLGGLDRATQTMERIYLAIGAAVIALAVLLAWFLR